jgi:hypothetical protein
VDVNRKPDNDLRKPGADGAAKSAAFSDDLAAVVEAWATLSKTIRQQILSLVRDAESNA